jgi:hypothetical protein
MISGSTERKAVMAETTTGKNDKQEHQQHLWQQTKAEPDDEQRRHGDFRHDLEEDQQGIDGFFHGARERHQQRQRDADDHRRGKTDEHGLERVGCRRGILHPAGDQFAKNLGWRGQDVGRQMEYPGRDLPQRQKCRDRGRDLKTAGEASHQPGCG